MEVYWEIVSYATGIALMGITGYLFYRFIKPFLIKYRYAGVIGVVYFIVMTVLYLIPWEMEGVVAYAIGTLTAFAAMYFIDRRNMAQKLFLATTMFLLNWISHGIAIIPRGILFAIFINPPYMMSRPILQFGCYVAVEIIYVVLRFLIMAFLIRIVNKVYTCKRENMSRKELALMCATPLSVLIGYGIFIFFSNAYLTDMEQYIWNVHSQYLWIKAFYQLISYIAIIATIVLYQRIKESHRKEKESAVLEGQIENLKKHISEVELLYRDIRGLKHDMANHVMILENLFQKNEHQQAMNYLSKWKEQLNELEIKIKSGNPVTDVILTEKQKEAEEKEIDFVCDFHYPTETGINAFDISVILNNAINNAIEAAGTCQNPYVHIKSWRQKNVYMIEVKNNFAGTIVMDKDSGLPESTKNGQEHGFGLANIRKVAQKYFGEIAIEQKENIFILSIMLMAE